MAASSRVNEKIVYSREKLFEINDTMPKIGKTIPPITGNVETDLLGMLFCDLSKKTREPTARSRSRQERHQSTNWRDHCNPHAQPAAISATTQDKECSTRQRRINVRETAKPLRRTANRFIPSCQRQVNGQQNEQDFARTLRSHFNKITKDNCKIICNEISNLLKSEHATDGDIATLSQMLLAKVIFDKGLCTDTYVKLCESVLANVTGKLDVFTAELLGSARKAIPGLQQTKEIVGVVSFATELLLQKILTETAFVELVNLIKKEEHRQTVAICHMVKTKPGLSAIYPSLYDSWAYSVAWELTKHLPKRVVFMCQDAIEIARTSRQKRFVVVEEPYPDTVEMWFGR